MQNIKELYLELSTKISADVPALLWGDLWHNQVNFLDQEHPFPTPAYFLSFRVLGTQDEGQKVQSLKMQVDCYIFYETMADTFEGSFNQDSALAFLDIIESVYASIHGTSGENYSEMRRTGLSAIDTGTAGNLYLQTFECVVVDYAAMKEYTDITISEMVIETTVPNGTNTEESTFIIPT